MQKPQTGNICYEIKPIFIPSANICHDFARIQISCLLSSEKEKLSFYKQVPRDYFRVLAPEEKLFASAKCRILSAYSNLEKAYLNTWNTETNVFAFAAYTAEEMIGFITGSLTGKNMFTRSLYITPQYRGYGIGTNLLNSAENAASLVTSNMELFSLSGAVSFYQNHGYKNTLVLGRIMKIKKLSNVTGVIPVFQWCNKLQSNLNVNFDIKLLQQTKHQPIFVYVNKQQKIDGVAIRMSDKEQKITINTKGKNLSKIYTQKLSEALNRSL